MGKKMLFRKISLIALILSLGNISVNAQTPLPGSFTAFLSGLGNLTTLPLNGKVPIYKSGTNTDYFNPSTSLAAIDLSNLSIGTNTVLGNATSGLAAPTALTISSCSSSSSALIWTTNTGYGCNVAVNAATLGGATFSAPGAIGSGTASTGKFTTVNGNTFTTGTYTITGVAGKTFTFSNTLTFAGTDSSTLNIGTGGTLAALAFESAPTAAQIETNLNAAFAANYVPVNGDCLEGNSTPIWTVAPCGDGSVTTVSVATANGFSGTVANSTTTPAITIIAGAITPTSVNGNTFTTGTYTLTGSAGKTLTFDNSITFTSIDGSTLAIGSGGTLGSNAYTSTAYAPLASPTFTGTVGGTNVIPLSVLAQIATNTVLGNATSGTANETALSVGSCSTTASALIWTTNTGFGCNTAVAASTVTTNANLTGPITSSGNTTSIASQTGTGTKFVVDTSPTLVTPTLGVALATSINGIGITASTGTIVPGTGTATFPAGNSGTVAELNVAQSWTAPQRTATETPTISTSTFTPVFSTGQHHRIDFPATTCTCTIANPAAIVAGQSGVFELVQGATSASLNPTWGSEYVFAGGTSSIVLTTTLGGVDYIPYYVDSTGTYIVLGGVILKPVH